MTLSAKQLSESEQRCERLIEICEALPEVTHEDVVNGHRVCFCCKSSLNEQLNEPRNWRRSLSSHEEAQEA